MASRWNPFLATCLVATGTKAAGYPQIWSFEEQCFPHHPANWWHSYIGRETVTPSLIVSTATPMESSTFLIWCAGMVIRSGTTWHQPYSSILMSLPSSVLWLRHWVPPCLGPAKVHREPGEISTYGTISFACLTNDRSFGSGQESILTVFSPFQSTRSRECDIAALLHIFNIIQLYSHISYW